MLGRFSNLETERLNLKKLSKNDLKDFYEYASNKKVGNNSNWKPHSNLKESEKVLDIFLQEKEYLGIHHKKDKKLIGIIGLHEDKIRALPKDMCRELGYGLNYNYWGKAYMGEACSRVIEYLFSNSETILITAYTSSSNTRSIRVMEKLGMKREGILKYAWKNYKGDIKDKCSYSISKDEFIKGQNNKS